MALQRLADVTEHSDDYGTPIEVWEELNDELEDSPYAIHCVPSSDGYGYVLTMEEEE